MVSVLLLQFKAEPGRPLAKAKEKAKKRYLPKKFHSCCTPVRFPFNKQLRMRCQSFLFIARTSNKKSSHLHERLLLEKYENTGV
jgi:hypothetical protein